MTVGELMADLGIVVVFIFCLCAIWLIIGAINDGEQ